MEKDWTKVFDTKNPFEAEIIKGMLVENDIDAVIVPRQDSSFGSMLPGANEIWVHESQAGTAKTLIAQQGNREGGETPGVLENNQ
ncbi:putative signal transducing protein [Chitinophaga lutea]